MSNWGTSALEDGACMDPLDKEIDELVTMRESMKLGPFQTKIIEGKVKTLLGESIHVMVMPLKVDMAQPMGMHPLLPGLHILPAFVQLKMGSNKVSVVVRNMSDSPIYLKKGVQIACMVSTAPVLHVGLSPEREATIGAKAQWETMSLSRRQVKLLEKLNLDGLSNWSPKQCGHSQGTHPGLHDIFALDNNESGCTSTTKHEICINDSEPFKEQFRCIQHHSWKRSVPHSGMCWMWGQFAPASLPGVKQWS